MLHKLTRRLAPLCMSVAGLMLSTSVLAAPPEVLNLAPANPAAVLVVPNMRVASNRIAAANQTVGSDMPQFDDLASQFRQSLGVLRGMRDDGAFMLVLTDASTLAGDKDKKSDTRPAIVLVLPVDDYATFLANFKATDTAGVTAIELPRGRPGFSKLLGSYALVSPRKDLLDSFAPANAGAALAQAAGLLGGKALEENDMTLIIDSKQMKGVLQPMLAATMKEQKSSGARPPVNETLTNTIISTLLEQSRMITLGLTVDDVAMAVTMTAQFDADSEMGKSLTNGTNSSSLLATLPDRPYVAAYSADLKNKFAFNLMQGIASMPLASASGAASEVRVFDANTTGLSGAIYAPRDLAFGQSLLNALLIVQADQPASFVKNFQKYISTANGQSIVYQFPRGKTGSMGDTIRIRTQYGANALSLGGVSIDQFKVDYDIPPAVINGMGDLGPVFMLIAGSNQSGYVGSAGKNTVITSRTDSQLVNDTFATASVESGIGSSKVLQNIGDRLPDKSVVQFYISTAGVVQIYNTMGNVHHLPPLPQPQTIEPVAVGIGSEASGMSARAVVPLSVLRYIQQTARDLMQSQEVEQPVAQQDTSRPPRASTPPRGTASGPQAVRDSVPTSSRPPASSGGPASAGGQGGPASAGGFD